MVVVGHHTREPLNKWYNRHDASLRADRGAPAKTDWLSFESAQQRAARRQASPNRLINTEEVAFRSLAKCTTRLVKATSLHFATQHIWQTS
ncbi:hypothetical protein SAMN05216289_11028 [Dokdonella immobilis]|uniref:Uncharacterized protein n=1 Tax=Dokdonella immobilis TaxID=578942 RepID=A0A1I4XIJ4_9GAMM|nr:hypothetical protein SAMN05216289_11028 [Dokdonella immobilis]